MSLIRGVQLREATGSYATTGSNVFIGDQSMTGSILMSGSVVLSNNYGGIYTTTNTGTQIQSFYIDQGNNLIHRVTSGGDHYFYEGNNAIARFVNGGTINLGGTSATNNPTVRIPAAGGMIVTGSVRISGSTTQVGDQYITGSLNVTGSTLFVGVHTLSGSNTITGNTILSGSIEVSGSSNFHNSEFIVTGSSNFSGSVNVTGNMNVVSGSSFYRWGNKLFNYGAFSSTQTQIGLRNSILSMSFNTTDIGGSGVSLLDGTKIAVENTGIYNLQFSAQLDRTTSGTNVVCIWFAYTGSSIANSATDVTLTGGAASNPLVAAWNYILPMVAGSYVEIYWSHDDNADDKIEIKATGSRANPTRPAVPSVIATLTQIA
jgi:hypothetical protein